MSLTSLFNKRNELSGRAKSYDDMAEFVSDHAQSVKQLLTAVGYNDRRRRLSDIAKMIDCRVLLLCDKQSGVDRFSIVDANEENFAAVTEQFSWHHSQAAASQDAANMLNSLPFPKMGARSFISVPVKNSHNLLSGLLIGISSEHIDNIDSRTQLLYMMAPLFEAELTCERLRQERKQDELRIISLNQNIEAMTADLKRERERSLENKELKSIFITNLSHEIRTPMNVVIGFIDLLDTARDDAERNEFIGIIKDNSRLLLNVIDNLIEVSKLQSSYMFKPSVPHQLNELLDELKNRYQERLTQDNKQVVINTEYSLQTPNDTIWNSDEIIQKVMEQLLDNACKFTDSGSITIGYTFETDAARFYVRDTGKGIAPGSEKSIFNMFSVGDNVPAVDKGNGLGLALAQKFVQLADGDIWVDTEYTGGACFRFSIPTEKL